MRRFTGTLIAVAAVATAGCGGPSKEDAVKTLRELNAACEAKDYARAGTFVKLSIGMTQASLPKDCERFVTDRHLSAKGTDVLVAKGKWGLVDEVLGEGGGKFAESARVPLDSCYALAYGEAAAVFWWDGKAFKVIDCRNITKLEGK
jgi:hypothetical protein